MTIRELIKQSKQIINKRLKFDPFSRFYKSPVFKQSLKKISKEEVRNIQTELLAKKIYSHLQVSRNKIVLKVLRGTPARRKEGWFFKLLLLLATVATTSFTGAFLRGKNPIESLDELSYGYEYSFALLTILLFHEFGHYFTARYYKVRVSLPYFIPLFLPAFHPGTMGAFIKMRSSIPGKRALFDIGIAGPLAGFAASLVFIVVGLQNLPAPATMQTYLAEIYPSGVANASSLYLGKPFLFNILLEQFQANHLPMNVMYHFPFIFAGWFGLFVTALNLIPIGQLDGGHITYAMFGDRAQKLALVVFALLVGLNFYLISNYNSYIWVLWSILIIVFIRFRHPPTMDDKQTLGKFRILLGWISYIIFILCFSPLPIYLI